MAGKEDKVLSQEYYTARKLTISHGMIIKVEIASENLVIPCNCLFVC